MDLFASRRGAQRPFSEAWFCELHLADGRGLWIRYTTEVDGNGQLKLRNWVRVTDHGVVGTEIEVSEPHRLTAGRAQGEVDGIAWDLALQHGPGHKLVPARVERLGIGRTYVTPRRALRATGTLTIQGTSRSVQGTGVLGHIYGSSNRTMGWAWAHSCEFEESPGTCFEVLSARLGLGPITTSPLTTMILHHKGTSHRFTRTRDLIATRSTFADDLLTFHGRNGTTRLTGSVQLGPHRATAIYPSNTGTRTCTNATHSTTRLHLTDTTLGIRETLVSTNTSSEIVSPPAVE